MSSPIPEPASTDGAMIHEIKNGSGEPPPLDRALGLKLARRLEKSADLLRQARLRVEGSRADGRRKTLARIDRAFRVIQDLERDAITLGVSPPYAHDVRALLSECDETLEPFVGRRKAPKAKQLRRLRREIRDIRRRLEALL